MPSFPWAHKEVYACCIDGRKWKMKDARGKKKIAHMVQPTKMLVVVLGAPARMPMQPFI
jgi:hypothetical protein